MRPLTYATVCSGVECMGAAVADLPMRLVFFAEIEPFPCAVLRHRYPDVPNLGDMCRIGVSQDGREVTNGTDRILLSSRLDVLAGRPAPRPKTAAWVRRWLERISDPATCPDAPRYKACGNGWATNQPRWIILRILFFEGIDPWNPEETTEPIETRGIAA